jgi:hypothetical protein
MREKLRQFKYVISFFSFLVLLSVVVYFLFIGTSEKTLIKTLITNQAGNDKDAQKQITTYYSKNDDNFVVNVGCLLLGEEFSKPGEVIISTYRKVRIKGEICKVQKDISRIIIKKINEDSGAPTYFNYASNTVSSASINLDSGMNTIEIKIEYNDDTFDYSSLIIIYPQK